MELASERTLAEMMGNKKKHGIPSDIQEIIVSRGLRRHELDIIECKLRNVSERLKNKMIDFNVMRANFRFTALTIHKYRVANADKSI